ncbi:MAG: ACP S-malonyltransferase [Spirochaetaceae bacterium]|jgi:[acyl-carrier-protein] S-malonyltransferase|nr:ACP S-malonyltransferase [Spirochaetaceae bacterium]
MVKNICFLFPGQGAQYPGMGLDLLSSSPAAKEVFDAASAILGTDMIRLIGASDGETLKQTGISQPAISAASLAAAAFLKERGIRPGLCAGFSLGEYPALACAGVIGPEDCFRLTKERGRAMQAAVDRMTEEAPEAPPGMAAVLGLPPGEIRARIEEWKKAGFPAGDLYAANINSAKQTVVSGSAAALAEAEARFKEAGARRVVRLQVAGPFHSALMEGAARAFAPALEQTVFKDPGIPFFSNVTGGPVQTGKELKELALRHITQGVLWTEEEAAIAALKPGAVLETGPGRVLQGLWRETGTDIPVYGAGTLEEILSCIKELS